MICGCGQVLLFMCAQEDVICLECTNGDAMKRGYLAAKGFGSQLCHLVPEAKNQVIKKILDLKQRALSCPVNRDILSIAFVYP